VSRTTVRATAVDGAFLVDPSIATDDRGSFTRHFDDALAAAGFALDATTWATSWNAAARTLRGLHYQAPPHAERKLVRCGRGRAFDVVVDLRPGSTSFRRWVGVELRPDGAAVAIPEGCAHGFLTLEPDTEIQYLLSGAHAPQAGRGLRWDDPALGVEWPATPEVISARDAAYPDVVWSDLGTA
jgi:dTDP-4-dehydrorhamnose 3,5-epimerase